MDIDNIIILVHIPRHVIKSDDVLSDPLTCNIVASSRLLSFRMSAQQSRNMEGGIHDIW